MENKLRQVTDSVHETIYLSALESELINTPYFYRLHDIYQSSTVYMTFPSNRTKRYEHSLGTMSIASEMLFSAVSNASESTKNRLFMILYRYFGEIYEAAKPLIDDEATTSALYFQNMLKESPFDKDEWLDMSDDTETTDERLEQLVSDYWNGKMTEKIIDLALDHYQYYPVEDISCGMEDGDSCGPDGKACYFLYRCLLQAVRIVALFHDVGHPPYSHIIENVLNKLRKADNSKWKSDKRRKFNACMDLFFEKANEPTSREQENIQNKTIWCKMGFNYDGDLHEKVSFHFLYSAFEDCMCLQFANAVKSLKGNSNAVEAVLLYYTTVAEFACAIMTNKDSVFRSIHNIVDGVLDADRMDYIVRDTKNSGVDWGMIPYKRIVKSAKLMYCDECIPEIMDSVQAKVNVDGEYFVIAYPRKLSDDIEDMLLSRYKIFSRINYHHRSMRTSMALESAVYALACDYLENDDNNCITIKIAMLWKVLKESRSKRINGRIHVVQWNDSWLITTLHEAMIWLYQKNHPKKYASLSRDLDEILLNRKSYYSLMKRGTDNQKFTQAIYDQIRDSVELVHTLWETEYEKYLNNPTAADGVSEEKAILTKKMDARDYLARTVDFKNEFLRGDLEGVCKSVALGEDDIKRICSEALEELQSTDKILEAYHIVVNKGRGKTGVPKGKNSFDYIHLFTDAGWDRYSKDSKNLSLQTQIRALELNSTWLYVYFAPAEKADGNTDELGMKIRSVLVKAFAEKIRIQLEDIFLPHPVQE